MAVVYRHLRNDTGSPFYVGIGKTNKRAYETGKRRTAHWNRIVQKHGCIVDIIYDGISWEEACKIEQYLISFYGRQDLGKGGLINKTDGGEGAIGHIKSKEIKAKIAAALIGKKHNAERKAKMSAWQKGIPKSEEHKANLRKPISEERKAKISAAMKGKKHSEEARANMSAAAIGKKQSEEHKANISAGKLGKKQSEEHKANRSAAMKTYWTKKRIENGNN